MEKMVRMGKQMFENMNEAEAREYILNQVKDYCEKYHAKKEFREGDRIPYASRVYDSNEMCKLVDSALEFWLTSGRYTEQFETDFAKYLGIRYCSLVNSGSSANLLAFMTLTSPLLKERQIPQEVRIRSDSGNGVDQPQAVTVSVKAEALLYAAFAVLVALIYLVVQRRPAIR